MDSMQSTAKFQRKFFRNRKSSVKIHMELQKIQSKQISVEKGQLDASHIFYKINYKAKLNKSMN